MPETHLLTEVLVLLIAAVIAVPIFHRLRVSPILGYLVAGIAIGPHGLGLIGDIDDMRHLAEFGVVFLLFAIGLEMKLARLWVMRRLVFGLGTAQVVVTGLVIFAIGRLLGLSAEAAVVAGGALALSSTAVVLQLLTDRGELTSRPGRIAFSILLMQDLAVVPLLALVSILGGEGPGVPTAMGLAAVQATAVLLAIVVAGRYLLRPALRLLAATRSTEVFAAAALLVVLGTSWLTAQVGLSMALGAFLAGLMLAETEFRHQVEADIQPFRGFLLGLFFITVGMSVDVNLVMREGGDVLVLVLGLLALKAAMLFALVRFFCFAGGIALHVGLLLAQGGEFAFVLLGLALTQGVMAGETAQLLTLGVSVTMILTPGLAALGARLGARLGHGTPELPTSIGSAAELHDHVIIAGFGRVGQTVARMLAEKGVPYVALDLQADRVAEGLSRGLPVFFADASRPEVLRLAGADKASAVVVTLDHAGRAERTVAVLRHAFPNLRVFARARDQHHSGVLRKIGASQAVPETLEASLQLGATLLKATGASPSEIANLLEDFRADDYARLAEVIPPEPEKERGRAEAG